MSFESDLRDGMQIDWDVPVHMDDGVVLRADVFRPPRDGRYPVILSHGPYAKGLPFQQGYPSAWERMVAEHPDVAAGSSNEYQNWEVVDPEKWVPEGYVCVRVDSRGAGRSPGFIDPFSPREIDDFARCIEWAGEQPWSNGKVGLNGISYYGINQWLVASRAPRHLAAICIWEGAADFYRDMTHHGGILSTFWANWYDMQVKTVQHGLGERGPRSPLTGELVCGPETLGEDALAANRCDLGAVLAARVLDDEFYRARSARWDMIRVPLLSAANWGGQGLHPRGNFEGFVEAASDAKRLEVHGLEHWTEFYTDYGVGLQKRFFARYLKDEPNGWEHEPPVKLQIRHLDRFVERDEAAWPIPRTRWTRYYLDPEGMKLVLEQPASTAVVAFDALGEGLTFSSEPLGEQTEITGPLAARLTASSSTRDADLFLVLRVFAPDGEEVVFQGAIDPHTPIAQGWLRASHRRLDPERSRPWRPYHTHDRLEPLVPGEPVPLEIELWPTSIVVPAGYRIALSVRGKDYEYARSTGARLSNFKNELRGCGPFLHDDERDRPAETFAGTTSLHLSPDTPGSVLLPVVPASA